MSLNYTMTQPLKHPLVESSRHAYIKISVCPLWIQGKHRRLGTKSMVLGGCTWISMEGDFLSALLLFANSLRRYGEAERFHFGFDSRTHMPYRRRHTLHKMHLPNDQPCIYKLKPKCIMFFYIFTFKVK